MLGRDSAVPIPDTEAKQIASVAKALAHPARVRIIAFLLSRPGCIGGDIVDQVGLAQSTVSQHLRILRHAGLVQGEIDYPRICYSLDPSALAPLQALIETVIERPPQGENPRCDTPDGWVPPETDA